MGGEYNVVSADNRGAHDRDTSECEFRGRAHSYAAANGSSDVSRSEIRDPQGDRYIGLLG